MMRRTSAVSTAEEELDRPWPPGGRIESSRLIRSASVVLLLLALALPARSEEQKPRPGKTTSHSWFLPYAGDQDVVLSISSIEWGSPDRWSFTSRYVHMFDKKAVRDHKLWLHSLTVTAVPGASGGRLGVGYGNVFSRLALLSEARIVLLRTWGRPLVTDVDRTFVGAEVRTSLTGVVNVGTGYYWPISGNDDRQDSFWGFHVGIGI
jgi:hypothetical protein